MKCLFLYHNTLKIPAISIGLSILISIAKNENYQCDLFDTTFIEKNTIPDQFIEKLKQFKPDILAITCFSHNWTGIKNLLSRGYEQLSKNKVCVIVGGPHPTATPNTVIKFPLVDIVVIGEGEKPFRNILRRISEENGLGHTKGIWYKEEGVIHKNTVDSLILTLDNLPEGDWALFSQRHLMQNADRTKRKIKLAYFETSRGCPYSCNYCSNSYYRTLYEREIERFHRVKSPESIVIEIRNKIDTHKFTHIFFTDESFLINRDRLEKLAQLYKSKIGLPFHIQTRPETINEGNLELISDMGVEDIHIGIESGNEKYRRRILNRDISNNELVERIRLIKKYNIKITTYNMIGLPHETKEMMRETIEINKQIEPDYANVFVFFPLPGTELFDLCIKDNLFDVDDPYEVEYKSGIPITKLEMSLDELNSMKRKFFNYSDSKLY